LITQVIHSFHTNKTEINCEAIKNSSSNFYVSKFDKNLQQMSPHVTDQNKNLNDEKQKG